MSSSLGRRADAAPSTDACSCGVRAGQVLVARNVDPPRQTCHYRPFADSHFLWRVAAHILTSIHATKRRTLGGWLVIRDPTPYPAAVAIKRRDASSIF